MRKAQLREPSRLDQPFGVEADHQDPRPLDPLRVDDGLESPARRLQAMLDAEIHSHFGEDVVSGRWSLRRTAAFVFVTCSLFWLVMWMAARAVL